ncbi:MAG: FkbM family methyltransferase [Paracoccaceae bacterium]
MLAGLAAHIGHLYPLKSGCGPLANSRLFRWLDPAGGPDGIACVTGGRAVVPAGDYVGRSMRFVGDLDPKVSWVVDRVLNSGDIALDIGSNLGLVSLRMAARVGPSGQVHAFDPQPRMQAYFRRTLDLNPDLPITLHPIGLGPESTTLELAIPLNNSGSASLSTQFENLPGTETVQVPVEPLDNYAQTAGITQVKMIKMDVEGFEAQVLQGAHTFLGQTRPAVILLEENAPDPETGLSPALELLQARDYTLYTLPRALWSVRLATLSEHATTHDYVAVAPDAPDALRSALGIN